MAAEARTEATALVVVVDVHPVLWEDGAQIEPTALVQAVLPFLNAHMCLASNNPLAVLATRPGASKFLYPPPSGDMPEMVEGTALPSAQCEPLHVMNEAVRRGLEDLCEQPVVASRKSDFPGAMSKGLCFINKQRRALGKRRKDQALATAEEGVFPAKMLVIATSPTDPGHYLPLMNIFFSAQKSEVPLDVCVVGEDSAVFQQGAALTGGVHMVAKEPETLLQLLLSVFLPTGRARTDLASPPPPVIDYRATCLCHSNPVTIGHVCSVCLSIHCRKTPRCKACKTFVA